MIISWPSWSQWTRMPWTKRRSWLAHLLSIILLLWLSLDVLPNLFVELFNTVLGIGVLGVAVAILWLTNEWVGLFATLWLLFMYRIMTIWCVGGMGVRREAFSWNADDTTKFVSLQRAANPDIISNTTALQSQASQADLDYYLEHGKWPWSPTTRAAYLAALSRNPYVRSYPPDAIQYAQQIYTDAGIRRVMLLESDTPVGKVLGRGWWVPGSPSSPEKVPDGVGIFGYTSGLMAHRDRDLIRCNNGQLERTSWHGVSGGLNAERLWSSAAIDPSSVGLPTNVCSTTVS